MGRHRAHVDGDVAAALVWWTAIIAGFGLLGSVVQQGNADAPRGRSVSSAVPDIQPGAGNGT